MSITAAKLQAEVGADTKGFDSGMAHADRTIKSAPGKWATALKVGAGAALAVGGALIVRGIAGAIRGGLDSLTEQGVVVAQTNAAIRSTKGAANVSAGAIRDLSTALEAKSGFDDKAIQSGANLLLTFTKIRNESGAGNDIFNQSTEVLTNMARALGTDVSGGAIQLGKALQDPLKGITALTRVGVTFDATQKKQIAGFMKTGKVAEAQKIILRELNVEFGKSNEEFMKTDAGKALLFQDAIEGVQQKLAGTLLPALTRVRGALTDALLNPETLSQVGALGDSIASIFSEGNLRTAASIMTTAAGAIGTVIKLFGSLPPEVQALAVGALAIKKITGIGVTDVVKTALGGLDLFKRGGSAMNPLYVSDVAGALGGKGGVPVGSALGAAGLWSTVGKIIGGAFSIVAVASIADAIWPIITNGGLEGRTNRGETLPGDQLSWPWGPKNTPKLDIGPFKNILGGDSGFTPPVPLPTGNIGAGSDWSGARTKNTLANLQKTPNQAILERAIAHGFKPSASAITATLARNAVRAAQAVASADAREASRSALLRSAVNRIEFKPTIVANFSANISVRTLQRAVAVNSRYQSGSRNLDRQP